MVWYFEEDGYNFRIFLSIQKKIAPRFVAELSGKSNSGDNVSSSNEVKEDLTGMKGALCVKGG